MSDPLFDGPAASADDPQLAALEQQLGVFRHTAPLRELPPRRAPRRRWLAPAIAVALAAAAALVLWLGRGRAASPPPPPPRGFAYALSTGGTGTLQVGAWLETPRDAVADVVISDIGDLTVYGGSRVKLVETGASRHHLELARGHVSAKVTAPPRLFVVDTPGASAVDLGCAYDLVVEPSGHTHLRVTSGAVSLEGTEGVVYVPATHEVDILPGHHTGTPVSVTAGPELRAAVARFDAGAWTGLAEVLAAAGGNDRVTLWNVVVRTHGDAAAVARLEELAPLPDPAMRPQVLAGDPDALDRWLDVFVERGDQAHDRRK